MSDRSLLVVLAMLILGAGLLSIAGAAEQAVGRHYDLAEQQRQTTEIQQKIAARRAMEAQRQTDSGGGSFALLYCLPAVAALLAAAMLLGHGGLAEVLANANKLVRSIKRKQRRQSKPRRLEPIRTVSEAPSLQLRSPTAREDVQWVESGNSS